MFWHFDKSDPNDRSYSVPITKEILKNEGTALNERRLVGILPSDGAERRHHTRRTCRGENACFLHVRASAGRSENSRGTIFQFVESKADSSTQFEGGTPSLRESASSRSEGKMPSSRLSFEAIPSARGRPDLGRRVAPYFHALHGQRERRLLLAHRRPGTARFATSMKQWGQPNG